MVYQIAEVDQPLGSVSRTCGKEKRVVFEADHGYIEHLATGEKHYFRRRNNVYVMTTWVEKPAGQKSVVGVSRDAQRTSEFSLQE